MYNGSQYNQIQYNGDSPIPFPSFTNTLDEPLSEVILDIPQSEVYASKN